MTRKPLSSSSSLGGGECDRSIELRGTYQAIPAEFGSTWHSFSVGHATRAAAYTCHSTVGGRHAGARAPGKRLGHASAESTRLYTRVSDPVVVAEYRRALGTEPER